MVSKIKKRKLQLKAKYVASKSQKADNDNESCSTSQLGSTSKRDSVVTLSPKATRLNVSCHTFNKIKLKRQYRRIHYQDKEQVNCNSKVRLNGKNENDFNPTVEELNAETPSKECLHVHPSGKGSIDAKSTSVKISGLGRNESAVNLLGDCSPQFSVESNETSLIGQPVGGQNERASVEDHLHVYDSDEGLMSVKSVSDQGSEQENERDQFMDCSPHLAAVPDGFSPTRQPIRKQNKTTPITEHLVVHTTDEALMNAKPVLDISEKISESKAHLVTECMLGFSLTPNESCLIGQSIVEKNLLTPNKEHPLVHLNDKGLLNVKSVSNKMSDSEEENESGAHLVTECSLGFSMTPWQSCLVGQPVGERNLITPIDEPLLVDTAEKRLLFGKSISDKYGKQSLCNLSVGKCGTGEKYHEDPEQQKKGRLGREGLPTRRALFPIKSTSVNYDIQETQSGNTVMFSLKRKLIRKVEEKPAHMKPDDECFLVSPVQKKILLAMQNRASDTNNGVTKQGTKCYAQSVDPKGAGSTVFLLKRKLGAKVSAKKTSIFPSPLKKKRMLARRKNRSLLIEQGDVKSSDETSLDLSSANASVQTSLFSERTNGKDEQDKASTHQSILTSSTRGISLSGQPVTENSPVSWNQNARTKNKKRGFSSVKLKHMHGRSTYKRIYEKQRYATLRKTKRQIYSSPKLEGNGKTDSCESSFPSSATASELQTESGPELKNQNESSASQNSYSSLVIERKFMQINANLKRVSDKRSYLSRKTTGQKLFPSSKPIISKPLRAHQGRRKASIACKVKRCASQKPMRQPHDLTSEAPLQPHIPSPLSRQKRRGYYSRCKSDANPTSKPVTDSKVSSGSQRDISSPHANAAPGPDSSSIGVIPTSEPATGSKHPSENELTSAAYAAAYSDGIQVEAITEEELIIRKFMEKMKRQRETNEYSGIRVRAVTPELDSHIGENAESEAIDQHFNPTFKKLKVFSSAKLRRNVFQLHQSEVKLAEAVAPRLTGFRLSALVDAEFLVKWCLKARKKLIVEFNKAFKHLAIQCDNWLTIAEQYSESDEKSEAILGLPLHSSSDEAYFYETAYKYYNDGRRAEKRKTKIKRAKENRVRETKAFNFALKMTDDGKVANMFPETRRLKKSFQWDCCGLVCRTNAELHVRKVGKIFHKLKKIKRAKHMVYFLRDMNKCNSSCCNSYKSGHSVICRMKDGKGAPMVLLQNLEPHYPHVRVAVSSLQTLKSKLHEIDDIDFALYEGDCQKLEAIADTAKLAGGEFKAGNFSFTIEKAIVEKYQDSFNALKKRMTELPTKYCFSCEKLLSRQNLRELKKMRNIPCNKWWKALIKKEEDGVSVDFICDFCLLKIRAGELPSIATLNKMTVPKVPTVIQNLNKFEKVFIQRAKAFQVVAKAGTVAGKKLPASHLNSKVVGRTFHLPLPLEETLKRILRDEQAVMPNQELYILVRGLPTNQKKVWESLVNVTNILKALEWLKMNNHLYKDIKLPNAAEMLLNPLEDIHYDDPDNPPTPDDTGEPPLTPDDPAAAHDPIKMDGPNEEPVSVNPKDSDDVELAYDLSDIGAQPKDPHCTGDSSVSNTADSDNPGVQRKDSHATRDDFISNAVDSEVKRKDAHPTVADIAAMLTQRNRDDAFYDNFTIFPVYERRENKAPTELYQMLKVEGSTMDSRAQKLDAQCFPDLYPDGRNYFHEDREVTLEFTEFVKAKLMSRHPQFRTNIQYLFFLLNQLTTRQLAAGIYQTLNITRKKFTAGEFLNNLGQENVERDMCSIFSRVRNTEQYWKKPRGQLFCMIENYGPATFFFTYSPSLYDDPELRAYLKDVNDGKVDGKTTSQLIANDPVSVSRFCDQKFKGILDFLTVSENGPLGEIVHYAWRREYQGRGTQHFHTLLWSKNPPVMGISSSEEVAQFIQDHITCSLPDKKTFPNLYEKVVRYQIHRDNAYCLRVKGIIRKKVCRFGFPRPITDKFILRDVPTSVAGRRNLNQSNRGLYDLPRKEDEVRVNDYNPALLLAVKHGNMDIQFVGEKSAIIVKYISKYVCKPEKSHMGDVFRDISSTRNQYRKLWSIGSVGLSNRECHALEAADTALGISLFGTDKDTVFKWIDVAMFRSRKLRTKAQIEQIAKKDPKSTDLYCLSMVDDHYPHRPDELEELCLHDYARDYDIVKTKPTKDVVFYEYPGFGYLRKRKKPCLVNHWRYDFKQQPDQYFYSILLLYKPWRRIDDLKSYTKEGDVCQYADFTAAFEGEKDFFQDALQYHEKRVAIQAAHKAITELIDEKSKEYGNKEKNIDFEIADDPHGFKAAEANEAMKEYREAVANLDLEEDLSSLEGQLNEDQRRVYDYVRSALQSKTPMRHYVSGVGGTGKSFLIKCIAKYCREKLKKDVAITAPTGIAAFGIGGATVHRILMVPIQHGKDFKYSTLNDTVLNILRLALKNTVVLIVDEISMISNLMLMFINLRLNEIFNTFHKADAYFGNIHILVFGDLLQLPPVKGDLPFKPLSKTDIKDNFTWESAPDLWNLFTYDELRINMRQKSDQKFAALLANIRRGFYSSDNMKTLLECKFVFKTNTPDSRTKELAEFVLNHKEQPVVLLPTRKMCRRLNDAVLSLLGGSEIHLVAQDSVECRSTEVRTANKTLKRLESDCSRTAGLEKHIVVKIGARVMLRRNIDVTKGYVNGAIGTILSAKTRQDGTTSCLRLQMKNGDILELTPITGKFELFSGIYVHRTQFPIQLAYGITTHKAQGLSLDFCIVDVGTQSFSEGQTYVALSRVKTLSGLIIINIDPSWVKAKTEALGEYSRLRSITAHLKSTAQELCITIQKKDTILDDVWAPKVESVDVYDETPPHIKLKASSLLPAFDNIDKVSCYANAILQCLLSYEPLRSALRRSAEDSALKQIADRYVKTQPGELLSAFSVRAAADASFARPKMEDATAFLLFLVSKSEVLKQMTEFTESLERKCSSCKVTTVSSDLNSFLQMPLDHKKVSDFLQKRFSWSNPKDFECPSCHRNSKAVERILITNPSDLLIVKVLLWNVSADGKKVKNTKFQMTALPSTNLKIGDCRFRLHAAAFHSGRGQIEVHHTAIVQFEKKCILADDSDISECKWPRGSKDAFLLFYCRIDGKRSVQAPSKAPLAAASKLLTFKETEAPLDNIAKPLVRKKIETLASKAPFKVTVKPLACKISDASTLVPGCKNQSLACYANASLQCLLSHEPEVSNVQTKSTGACVEKNLSGVATETTILNKVDALILPAFENKCRVSCYANASLQSLLSYSPVRSALSRSEGKYALKDIANQYLSAGQARSTLSAIHVRKEAGLQFVEERQQDPHEFLNVLFSRNVTLRENVRFTLVDCKKCNVCGYEPVCNAAEYYMLSLPANEGETDITQILDKFLSGSTIPGSTCSECRRGEYVESFVVQDPSDVFVLHFKLWNNDMVKNRTFQIKDVPSSNLTVDSALYRFHSATFHHGESVHSGHYTAVVRSGSKFIRANDTEVTECSWPEEPLTVNQDGNETAVNAYLLFYCKVK